SFLPTPPSGSGRKTDAEHDKAINLHATVIVSRVEFPPSSSHILVLNRVHLHLAQFASFRRKLHGFINQENCQIMRVGTSRFSFPVLLLIAIVGLSVPACSQSATNVEINAGAPSKPFPHFWEQTFGSGRAILVLRDSYLTDLREVKKVTDFQYVRFHNI